MTEGNNSPTKEEQREYALGRLEDKYLANVAGEKLVLQEEFGGLSRLATGVSAAAQDSPENARNYQMQIGTMVRQGLAVATDTIKQNAVQALFEYVSRLTVGDVLEKLGIENAPDEVSEAYLADLDKPEREKYVTRYIEAVADEQAEETLKLKRAARKNSLEREVLGE